MASSGFLSPPFLISSISSLVFVRLENHNFLPWKSQFLPVLRANVLIGFVDGTGPCPLRFKIDENDSTIKEINPEYSDWVQLDQNVLCWINATLSEGVLAHVVGHSTTKDVWTALELRFASLTRSHVIQLKTQLQAIKKGNMSIADYAQEKKTSFR